jgi:hypothetical protein
VKPQLDDARKQLDAALKVEAAAKAALEEANEKAKAQVIDYP